MGLADFERIGQSLTNRSTLSIDEQGNNVAFLVDYQATVNVSYNNQIARVYTFNNLNNLWEKKGNDITNPSGGFTDIFISEDGTILTVVESIFENRIKRYYFSNGLWLQEGSALLFPNEDNLINYSKMENNTLIIDTSNGYGLFFIKCF